MLVWAVKGVWQSRSDKSKLGRIGGTLPERLFSHSTCVCSLGGFQYDKNIPPSLLTNSGLRFWPAAPCFRGLFVSLAVCQHQQVSGYLPARLCSPALGVAVSHGDSREFSSCDIVFLKRCHYQNDSKWRPANMFQLVASEQGCSHGFFSDSHSPKEWAGSIAELWVTASLLAGAKTPQWFRAS